MEETEKLDELLNETMETTTNEEDDFSRMLKEFIDSALEDKTEETPEEDETPEKEETPEEDNDLDFDLDLTDYPDGTVKFNENNSVKVEVLLPIRNPKEEPEQTGGVQEHQTTDQ